MLQGEDWKRVRSIVSPTFTTGKIKRMMNIFTSCSKVLINNFRKYAEKGEPVDLKKIFGTFSMDVIANAAFSTQIDSHSDPNNEFVKMARSVFQRNAPIRILIYHITKNIIEERKRTGETRNDFLQLLIEAADEQIKEEKDTEKTDDILKNYEAETNEAIFKNFKPKKTLSTTELVAQCVIFFLAGFETSASTLAFACYQLALNPDIQDKLVEELDDAIRSDNGELSYETIQNLKYLDNVISETMRLSPPSVRLERVAGGRLQARRHFSSEERAKRSPYTFMPFGAGPRNCVAMRFALVEVKVCLAYVLSHFKIRRCPETKVSSVFLIHLHWRSTEILTDCV
ncbi:cytochrome P450 3A21 [Caerostris extrusa]|uniref:Cytochrome P450 3A21 n=1 Tax=Caerostris extrusa TaxID=172846 RepID=A0AAV4XT85_CAEEX|nr:cytochrome P450 3A21 [Caerostris extrusa]